MQHCNPTYEYTATLRNHIPVPETTAPQTQGVLETSPPSWKCNYETINPYNMPPPVCRAESEKLQRGLGTVHHFSLEHAPPTTQSGFIHSGAITLQVSLTIDDSAVKLCMRVI